MSVITCPRCGGVSLFSVDSNVCTSCRIEERESAVTILKARLEALEEVAKAAREFWLAIDNHEWFDEAKKQALYDALYKLEQLEEKQA